MVQKQIVTRLDELALTSAAISRLAREGFNSVEDLVLCTRPDLTKLVGPEMTDEIELALMLDGRRLSLSRTEKLRAIKELALATFEEAGGQAARIYFIDALTAHLDETAERELLWQHRAANLLSGHLASSKSFELAINTVYSELFPNLTVPD